MQTQSAVWYLDQSKDHRGMRVMVYRPEFDDFDDDPRVLIHHVPDGHLHKSWRILYEADYPKVKMKWKKVN